MKKLILLMIAALACSCYAATEPVESFPRVHALLAVDRRYQVP